MQSTRKRKRSREDQAAKQGWAQFSWMGGAAPLKEKRGNDWPKKHSLLQKSKAGPPWGKKEPSLLLIDYGRKKIQNASNSHRDITSSGGGDILKAGKEKNDCRGAGTRRDGGGCRGNSVRKKA